MRFRLLLVVMSFLALTAMGFSQEGNTYFKYPANDDCAGNNPLAYGTCWTGVSIPDGTPVEVYKNGTLCWTFDMNSLDICTEPGYFIQWYPCMADNGDQLYVRIAYQGCTYTSATFTVSGAPEPQFYDLIEANWTCQCQNPGCDVKEEQGGLLRDESKSKESLGSVRIAP